MKMIMDWATWTFRQIQRKHVFLVASYLYKKIALENPKGTSNEPQANFYQSQKVYTQRYNT